jgi:hypothetical protein
MNFEYTILLMPMLLGGALIGSVFIGTTFWFHRKQKIKQREENKIALERGEAVETGPDFFWGTKGFMAWFLKIFVIVASPLIGAWFTAVGYFSINTFFDNSEPEYQITKIDQLLTTETNFIFREYEIIYFIPDTKKTETFYTSPEHLNHFTNDLCKLEISRGHFGWPWVKDVHPIEILPTFDENSSNKVGQVP